MLLCFTTPNDKSSSHQTWIIFLRSASFLNSTLLLVKTTQKNVSVSDQSYISKLPRFVRDLFVRKIGRGSPERYKGEEGLGLEYSRSWIFPK